LKIFDPGQRGRRLGTALLLLLLPVLPVQARGKSRAWATTQFSNAEQMRKALDALPAKEQSRHEYQRVISAYRRVYYGAPASAKADRSVAAVADLLAEMGRSFNNEGDLRSAIGQYKFLQREYPGSRGRFQALFNIAQIYQDDLKEPAQAKAVFEEFLRRYPRNRLADAARNALAQPVPQAAIRSKASDRGETDNSETKSDETKRHEAKSDAKSAAADDDSGFHEADSHDRALPLSRITDVRHWSNPNYTRVAIDLQQDAKFESRRIENPERIFFDLRNTNLAPKLRGKTFDVDDGLLKRIRMAQFQPGKSRIVLEVADRSDYDTFLLTDPPRLIVDIHGKDIQSKDIQKKDIHVQDFDHEDGAAKPNLGERKPSMQPVQAASLKEAEPISPASSTTANTTLEAGPEDSTATQAKLPVIAMAKNRAPLARAATVSGAKKTVVEADSSDDDRTVTVAKLDPPNVQPPDPKPSDGIKPRSAGTLAQPPSKSSAGNKRKSVESFPDVREASPTANGDRSLIRALGLKIGKIVIDPGHGGHDTGTIGPNGLEEKDLVLDVGRRLGKLLQARLGADVVYTRKDDTFIPLETRTSIANQEQADLFVSIHANSSRDSDARGVETYYLNFTSSAESLDVAARENAASDKSIHELQDLVKKIALKEKIEESREFASNVQRALHSGLATKSPGIRDRGVKKAPFIVLIGANMPSILAEISFVSNPGDERRLRTSDYRQRIAESLYRGISKYVSGLSGVKVAAKIDKGEAQ
jgi:N-acetylmuramoyl-L-alanine amidase